MICPPAIRIRWRVRKCKVCKIARRSTLSIDSRISRKVEPKKVVYTLVGIFGTLGWIPAHLLWAFVSLGNIEAICQIGGNEEIRLDTGG